MKSGGGTPLAYCHLQGLIKSDCSILNKGPRWNVNADDEDFALEKDLAPTNLAAADDEGDSESETKTPWIIGALGLAGIVGGGAYVAKKKNDEKEDGKKEGGSMETKKTQKTAMKESLV